MRPFPLMVFAAGFGTRMGDLTRDRPKPLIEVAGRTLIDRALDLAPKGARIVVNLHYRGDQMAAHLRGRDLFLSHEPEILETGGGLKAALPHLGEGPVMTLNPDAVWVGPNPLQALAAAWDDRMLGLLLVAPAGQVRGRAGGAADFRMDAQGRLARAGGAAEGFVYLGAQIVQTGPVRERPESKFSMNRVWDRMIAADGLHGLCYPGAWCDVGTPGGLAEAESMLGDAG